jgi:hypothetical protein
MITRRGLRSLRAIDRGNGGHVPAERRGDAIASQCVGLKAATDRGMFSWTADVTLPIVAHIADSVPAEASSAQVSCMFVLVQDPAESIASSDVEAGDLVGFGERRGQRV